MRDENSETWESLKIKKGGGAEEATVWTRGIFHWNNKVWRRKKTLIDESWRKKKEDDKEKEKEKAWGLKEGEKGR